MTFILKIHANSIDLHHLSEGAKITFLPLPPRLLPYQLLKPL